MKIDNMPDENEEIGNTIIEGSLYNNDLDDLNYDPEIIGGDNNEELAETLDY